MLNDPWDQGLIERVGRDDRQALDELLSRHRGRLVRTVELRLDRRVRGRIDPSDVIQDTCLEACQRIDEYHQSAPVPFFVWLRFLAIQKLAQIHRRELGVQARDARREIALHHGSLPAGSTALLADCLVGKLTGPNEAVLRAERKIRLQEALALLPEDDRELLMLRHFEQLSNAEIAHALAISQSAACHRYVRGLERLKRELGKLPGGMTDWEP